MTDTLSVETRGRVTIMACPKCANLLHEIEDRGRLYLLCCGGHRYAYDDICPGIERTLRSCLADALRTLAVKRQDS